MCAHFLIDTDGTIYQLADLGVRCRHTIGLDDVAIGIEHVGTSAKSVLRNAAMMRSSLRLTLWLMASQRIEVRDVIGHAESLESPYHHERYRDWACMTARRLRPPRHAHLPGPAARPRSGERRTDRPSAEVGRAALLMRAP